MFQQTVLFTQGRSAALITAAGTLLRASILTANPNPRPVALYRIPNMTITAQWIVPGTAMYANGDQRAGVALVQTGAAIRLFYVDATSQSMFYRESTDDGVTWAASTLIKVKPVVAAITYLVCTGIAPLTTTDLTAAWHIFDQAASGVFRMAFSAGVWQPWVASTGPIDHTVGQLRGWSVDPSQPTKVYVAGNQRRQQMSGISAAAATQTGGVWAPGWTTIHSMDTATNGLSFKYPAVHYDPSTAKWWCGVCLQDDGTITGTTESRTLIFASSDGLVWTLVQMLYGSMWGEVHVLFHLGIAYVFDNEWMYTAPANAAQVGLETDLLRLSITEKLDVPQSFTLVFSNNAGQYNGQPYLRENAQVSIYLGYNGTTIQTHTCHIDDIEYIKSGDIATMTIHGRCIQKELDQVVMQYLPFTSATIATIVTGVVGNQILLAALPVTPQFSQTVPSFAIVPGQTRAQALKRLSDVFQFDMFTTTADTLKIVERAAGDASTWTYYQEHLGIALQQNADQPNIVRVIGAPPSTIFTNIFAQATDHAAITLSGNVRYRHIVDRLLDTSAKCLIKANLALRDDQTQVTTAALTVTLNPMHELLDVITINEPDLGLAAVNFRIKGITTIVDWHSGQWEQHLALDLP